MQEDHVNPCRTVSTSHQTIQGIWEANFRAVLTFVVVVELKGLSAASKALNLSVSTVSRNLSQFCEQYERKLFTRTSWRLEPTAEAYDLARQLGAKLDALYSLMSTLGSNKEHISQ